ncbi:MAG: DUF3027 domain-containing protein [Nocardioidaceae bacterium]|nr:DUF3027 domain-containing protein [Nocardioidaceae bacterium]
MADVSTTHPRVLRADAVCAEAVDLARAALVDAVGTDKVGEHEGVRSEGERLVTHIFGSTQPGYRGWRWSVTVARASRQRAVTLNEIVLLPGDEAIVAPPWTPYQDRIAPGDLSPGDLLPPQSDDVRLVPGYDAGDPASEPLVDLSSVRPVADEVGLGRTWVLSLDGRDMAAERWNDGEQGPDSPLAKQAPGRCHDCGFMVRLSGPLSGIFGVCANGQANDDGRVVAHDHGCGAHSDAKLGRSAGPVATPPPVFDTVGVDDVESF